MAREINTELLDAIAKNDRSYEEMLQYLQNKDRRCDQC